jgi:hypothetical protein
MTKIVKLPRILSFPHNHLNTVLRNSKKQLPFAIITVIDDHEKVARLDDLPHYVMSVSNKTTGEACAILMRFNVDALRDAVLDPMAGRLLTCGWLQGLRDYYLEAFDQEIQWVSYQPNHLSNRMVGYGFGPAVASAKTPEEQIKEQADALFTVGGNLFDSMQWHASEHAIHQTTPWIEVRRQAVAAAKSPFGLMAALPGGVRFEARPRIDVPGYVFDDRINATLHFAGNEYSGGFTHAALGKGLNQFVTHEQLRDALYKQWEEFMSGLTGGLIGRRDLELVFDKE